MPKTPHPLTAWRNSVGISVFEAAKKAGVTRQSWYRWERGASLPDAQAMRKIFEMTDGKVTANHFYKLGEAA